MSYDLPDDFSWREFDRHFGDDQPEADEPICEHAIPINDVCPICDRGHELWLDHLEAQ